MAPLTSRKLLRSGHASFELLLVIMWIFGFSLAALRLAQQQRWAVQELVKSHRELFIKSHGAKFLSIPAPNEWSRDRALSLRMESDAKLRIDRYPRAMPTVTHMAISPPLGRGVIPISQIRQPISIAILRPAWTWNGPSLGGVTQSEAESYALRKVFEDAEWRLIGDIQSAVGLKPTSIFPVPW